MDSKVVGILGGGQLGRMLVEAAHRLNVKTVVLDAPGAPAKQINALDDHVDGSFSDASAIAQLAAKSDVLTVEIEHVDADALAKTVETTHVKCYPLPETIKLIQDKYVQKEHLIKHGIEVAESVAVESTPEALKAVGDKFGYPFMLKSRTLAYDGRGNFVVKSVDDISEALKVLHDRPLYAEKWAPFVKELAVMVVRSIEGEVFAYPTVETIHENNICHLVYAPARVADSIQYKAQLLAQNAVKSFPGAGIFGVEMFLLASGELLINEIAPRPHNSGHYTIDACVTSQFEAHIRAVAGLPLPKGFTSLTTSNTNAIMLNVLGTKEPNGELETCRRALETPGASVYLYGKSTRFARKMGHINVVASSMAEAERRLAYIMGETDTLEVEQGSGKVKPVVGIIMGSDSDLPVMAKGADILKKFNVPFEVTIVSAHRTPHRMSKYAVEAHQRGIKTIIAGAGGAAHLPGMVAAMTPLPVIGVPVKGSTLDGVDSLHSIVQMPRGIPVATVAINNATNAALLAIRILGTSEPKYLTEMQSFLLEQEEEVLTKAERLESVGYEKY
ncbi:ADE2 [Cyberlindnera jadinii]|uniref:Phosphoribosylaminoimidazole carboxylase n=1 Tax=Cyberlindnera jadinii (strain ATCC 18201 / CBS 1600 / BCRC 20928 / JCM 3617 / NBRC 0987 / NRRL Y-1542) TaxID=983966 RepID=A0A0H5CEX9_CYBJN|nr:Phosphoribosylaminoimidazole carboxylase [Cyberlindnera jadinii NRRL Y-1542]ODV74371.1 Phosphoribosylaminoimidazole carboxylase [Cyberlindnera jadinii NRRL Y-1542]CEP23134.1 ADE2 [Cyberlindnera jadinii]